MTDSRKRVVIFGSLIICLTLAMGLTALVSVRLAHAASFAVTDCSQEGTSTTSGTIAKAIADATADGGTSESITFNCGTATIPITTPLVVNMSGKTLVIDGGGTITIDGGNSSQIMQITSSSGTTLENLSFTHGLAPSATPHGGALTVAGSDLTLTNDTFANDVATADAPAEANGGALFMNGGTLMVQNSTFTNDSVQGSGEVEGGAVYILSTMGGSISNSAFDHDSATSTSSNLTAWGGAVVLASGGLLNAVSGDSFTNDSATSVSQSLGGAFVNNNSGRITTMSGCTFDHDSATAILGIAQGGALFDYGITSTLSTTDFTNNIASGAYASGGAIDITGTLTTISRSAFVGNSADAVDDNNLSTPAGGGAIANAGRSPTTVANSTFAANSVAVSGGAQATGGAIFDYFNSSTALVNDTLSGDSVDATSSYSSGGEVYVYTSASLTITTSILANGTLNGAANNCGVGAASSPYPAGMLTDGGNNIDSGASCGFSSANHSLSNTNPKLGTPASFSGSTLTYPLLPESPAIDAGNDSVCGAAPVSGIDQRGETRPQGAHCDIGAYEFARITTGTTLSASPSTQAQGQSEQLCATVTPASGTPASLGAPSGTVTFYDGSTSLGSAILSGGKGCFSTSALSLGTHNNLTAKYGGDPSFLGSTSAPASVFIGVTGNGGAASGAQPVTPRNPTGGPVTSTGNNNNSSSSSGTANSSSKTANSAATQFSLPGWLLVLLALIVLGGAAGGAFYLRQRGLPARPRAR